MDYSLSGQDIKDLLNDEVYIYTYKDLYNFRNIDDLLGKFRKVVVLYLNSLDYGHWTCLYEHNNTIYFFDSYGAIPDTQQKFIKKDINEYNKQDLKYLLDLLYSSEKNIEYNQYKLQKFKKGINTCGRWCVVRLQHPEISVDMFAHYFLNQNVMNPDELVVKLTNF